MIADFVECERLAKTISAIFRWSCSRAAMRSSLGMNRILPDFATVVACPSGRVKRFLCVSTSLTKLVLSQSPSHRGNPPSAAGGHIEHLPGEARKNHSLYCSFNTSDGDTDTAEDAGSKETQTETSTHTVAVSAARPVDQDTRPR
jgi:hypothetical protein